MTNTPNMNLQLPAVGIDTGLQWELSLNANSSILDSHNHTPGSGVPVTPLGLNINSNLSIGDNSLTRVFGVSFSTPASTALTSFLYTAPQSGGGIYDLFFNDGAGNVVPLTKAGVVNATVASIPGESYGGGTFTWVQGSGSTIPANFDIGSVTIRPNTAGTTNGITLSCPAGISSAYAIALPALPGAQSFQTIDASGNMAAPIAFANGITRANLAAVGQISSTNIFYSNATASFTTAASITIVTTGRPVIIFLQPTTGSNGLITAFNGTPFSSAAGILRINRDALTAAWYTTLTTSPQTTGSNSSDIELPPGCIMVIDQPSAGSHTYLLEGERGNANSTVQILNCTLVAYEL